MCRHVFEEYQANAIQIWKSQMYELVEEFCEKPMLPPPFIILIHVYRTLRYLLVTTFCLCGQQTNKPRSTLRMNVRLIN